MSVELFKIAMRKFLTDPRPLVLCVRGKWGTGKTYAWNEALKEVNPRHLPMSKYAYVSLFGTKDAADILQSAYVNADDLKVTTFDVRLTQSMGVTRSVIAKKVKQLTNAISKHASVPYVSGLGGLARAVMSNLVQETIVCIDDIERKGSGVTINEIMGVAAQLRDARRCKVVLILNENSLDNASRDEFQRYAEKVIDMSFVFAPSPKEAATIAFPDQDNLSDSLREACEDLAITNVRVLKKIADHSRRLMDLMVGIDPTVSSGVLRSFVVIAWSIISPAGEGAPDIEYLLEKRHHQYFGSENHTFTDAESAWGAQLSAYGFTECDEFDRTMVEDLQRGFFNEDKIREHIKKYLKDARKAQAMKEIEEAWTFARTSFEENGDKVAEEICRVSIAHIAYVSILTLNGTVTLLKGLGHQDKAMDLLDRFIAAHATEDIFDLRNNLFAPDINDPDVIKAFDAQLVNQPRKARSPHEAIARINSGGWSQEDETILRSLSVDDFEALFRSIPEAERPHLVRGALKFFSISNARPDQIEISQRAKEALIRIGNDGPMNRFRVRALGIHV